MPATTTRMGLQVPQPTDSNNIPGDLLRLANELDLMCVSFVRGTAAARPTSTAPSGSPGQSNYNPGTQGRWYWATDTGALSYDYGGGWFTVPNALAVLTTKGDLLVATGGAGNAARLPVGGDGQSLVARSGAAGGMDWETITGYPLGLAGAASPTRFVGATSTDGPPSSGTFSAGDFVTCPTSGRVWVCQAAGSPGTWLEVGSQQPAFCASPNMSPIASGGYVAITGWGALGVDTHNAMTSTGYVIPKAGIWRFDFQLMMVKNGVGQRYARLTRNGDPAWGHSYAFTMACVPGSASNVGGPAKSMVTPYPLNVGDVINLQASQDSGATLGVYGTTGGYILTDSGTTLSGSWLHS